MDLQKKHWDPLLAWAEETYGVKIRVSKSLFGSDQTEETKARFAEVMKSLDEWQLAGEHTKHYCRTVSLTLRPPSYGALYIYNKIILDCTSLGTWSNRC